MIIVNIPSLFPLSIFYYARSERNSEGQSYLCYVSLSVLKCHSDPY